MTETRSVVACAECQSHWYVGHEDAKCIDPDHTHRRFAVHHHRSVVALPDGTEITAVSFDKLDPYSRDHLPDYGLYLDRRWEPPWPHGNLHWPDFGVPEDSGELVADLMSLLGRARRGERVEVGCLGGHGRTGTALACLAILTGCAPGDAVGWVRENYCPDAVENRDQEAFVAGIAL